MRTHQLVTARTVFIGAFFITTSVASASTTAYWRFENSFTDEAGAHTATPNGLPADPFQANAPGTLVPLTGALNNSAVRLSDPIPANGTGNGTTGRQYLSVSDALDLRFDGTQAFTIEARIKIDLPGDINDAESSSFILQKKGLGSLNDGQENYAFLAQTGKRASSVGAFSGRELSFEWGQNADNTLKGVISNLALPDPTTCTGSDCGFWYVSVAYDPSAFGGSGEIRFTTAQSSADLLVDSHDLLTEFGTAGLFAPHTVATDGSPLDLLIGAKAASNGTNRSFGGLLDELRISNTFLPASGLLVPEPSTGAMFVAGLAMLSRMSRRRAADPPEAGHGHMARGLKSPES